MLLSSSLITTVSIANPKFQPWLSRFYNVAFPTDSMIKSFNDFISSRTDLPRIIVECFTLAISDIRFERIDEFFDLCPKFFEAVGLNMKDVPKGIIQYIECGTGEIDVADSYYSMVCMNRLFKITRNRKLRDEILNDIHDIHAEHGYNLCYEDQAAILRLERRLERLANDGEGSVI